MNRITAVIAEDEAPARKRISSFCEGFTEIEIVGLAEDGEQAVEIIRHKQPDLLFLDIQMPKLNGFEILEQLEQKPMVIFSTAYDEFAIRAFEVHAMDYLLKPYSHARFKESVQRALESNRDHIATEEKLQNILDEYRSNKGWLQRISVKKEHSYFIMKTKHIDYFKSEDGLVYLTQGDESFVIDASLNALEAKLDPTLFLRVHRNAIVNLSKIIRVVPWGQGQLSLSFEHADSLFVSRSHINELRKRIGLRL